MSRGSIDEREARHTMERAVLGQMDAIFSIALVGCVEAYCRNWETYWVDLRRANV
jgi:hypothetical protein